MAHFKRKRSRTAARSKINYNRWRLLALQRKHGDHAEWFWMSGWPRWWDIVFHRRPHRRRAAVLLGKIKAGADPDAIAWPVSKKPHLYYW
jgi:hypothetical protein